MMTWYIMTVSLPNENQPIISLRFMERLLYTDTMHPISTTT